ncbi:hypothetical protein ABVT39_017213 [Epinephelus coioides]
MATATDTPAAAVPFVITFGYKNFRQDGTNKRSADCKACGINIKDAGSTTSNFIRHLKTHPDRFSEFNRAKKVASAEGQTSLDSFLTKGVQIYSQGHPRQKAITESIIQDLIISCNLPLSLIDKPSFKNFMSVVEERYCPVSRSTVTRHLSELAADKESKIKSKLEKTDTVSVTVDIWTDPSMRGFLGVTAHFMEMENNSPSLQTVLLSCERFTGSHTGERISEKFEDICDNFNIKHKLDYIICDNASNMRKAFTVCFPSATTTESEDGDDDLENSNLWEDLSDNFQDDVESIQCSCRQQRLQCFAYSLQLVVRDGLKETKTLNSAMAKVTKFCSLLHSTCGLKEAFEKEYGANRSIPSAVSTRWNTTLRLVESITDLDPQSLNTLLEAQGHKGLCLSARELSQLKELVDILSPFLQAADLTQGEKVVTLSAALPCVLSLNSHLNSMLKTARHLGGFVKALQKSLQCRFQGIFANVRMDDSAQPARDLPFGDVVYMMSALLDPSFCFFWVEQDVLALDEVKSEVKEMIIDLVLAEAQKVTTLESSSSGDDDKDEPPAKTPRLFTGYRRKSNKKDDHVSSSVRAELIRYIQLEFSKLTSLLNASYSNQGRGTSKQKARKAVKRNRRRRKREAMFYIVEFYETQEVEVVPAAWVADDVCQWPTYYKPDELAKAIKNEEQPGDSWEEYRVRILYKAASYKAARLKLPEAETHTDLQTAEEDDDMPRRKRKRKLLTNQEMIMDQLKIVTLTLQKIQGEHVGGQEVLEADLFPLKDISSLLAVERRVREEADYKKKMITALSVIGGVDIKDTVWRIMKHLFTNSLAKQLNWRGVNGKTAFHSLQLKDIITGECYPQTHGAAARVTLAALGVYRLQKSGASDIGYLALQLCVFRGAPSDPQARLLD